MSVTPQVAPVIGIANWGPLVIGTDIDDAMLAALKRWMPTYLRQYRVERNLSFNPALPRTYANTFEGHEFLDHQLPALVCTTASLQATQGGPNIPVGGAWQSLVACVVRGKQPRATRYLAAMYGGTVARVVLQKARGGALNDMRLSSARYEQVPDVTGQSRWLLAAVQQFTVFTDEIVQPWAGPDIPDADEYVGEATVVEVDIDVLGAPIVVGGLPLNEFTLVSVAPSESACDAAVIDLAITGSGFVGRDFACQLVAPQGGGVGGWATVVSDTEAYVELPGVGPGYEGPGEVFLDTGSEQTDALPFTWLPAGVEP